jgi:hypothetical protein
MSNEIIQNTSIQTLIEAIEKRAEVIEILKEAKNKIGADDVRFRLRGWNDKSVVHVANWIIEDPQVTGLAGFEPELAERFYYDPEHPSRIDCLVGLKGRIGRIKEEEMKITMNEKLLQELRIMYLFSWDEIPGNDSGRLRDFLKQNYSIDWVKTARIEKIDDGRTIRLSFKNNFFSLKLNDEKTKVSLKIDDGRTDEFIARTENGKLTYRIIENQTTCSPEREGLQEFTDFIQRLNEKIDGLKQKKETWEEHLKKLKDIKNHDKKGFFKKAINKNSPWMILKADINGNKDDITKQWEDLQKHLEREKPGNEVNEFLLAVEKTAKHYDKLYKQYEEYIYSAKVLKNEIAVPVIAFGKFIGVLNFHKKNKFDEDAPNLAKIYGARLAVTYLQWQDILFDKFQKVAQPMTAENNFELIASKITEGVRIGLQHGIKEEQVSLKQT